MTMKTPACRLLAISAVAFSIASFLPETVEANDRAVLSSRASKAYQRVAREMRENKIKRKTMTPAERLRANIPLYRYEADPTMRHDEVSSPEVVFHFENRRVVAGHDWER